jgi:hypothetical protein
LPNAQDYRRALAELESELPESHISLLKAHYSSPDHTATATELAAAVNFQSYSGVNLQYGLLGERLREKLGFRGDEQSSYVIASFVEPGTAGNAEWQLVMHAQLARALEDLGWV